MIIPDAILAKTVEKWSKYGLRLWWRSSRLTFLRDDIRITLDLDCMDKPPYLTPAALVKMLGFIPEGRCIEIIKTSDGYNAQELMESVVLDQIEALAPAPVDTVRRIPLSWNGMYLFQNAAGAVFGVWDAPGRSVFDLSAGLVLSAEDDESSFATKAFRPDEPPLRWQALESVMWLDDVPAPSAAAEAEGQEVMDDE